MPDDDEYEIMPHREIKDLRSEIDKLKRNPLGATDSGKSLLGSVDGLNENIMDLLKVFRTAADEMKLEERDTAMMSKGMKPIIDKLDTIIDQNRKIAQGIVAVADMIEGKPEEKPRPLAPPPGVGPMMPPPMPDFDRNMPPPPDDFSMPNDFGMSQGMPPPPPPGMPPPPPPDFGRKSLFGKFRK